MAVTTTAAIGVAVPGPAAADVVNVQSPAPLPRSHKSDMARAGSAAERLWLLGGVALSLTAAGVVAVAATRGGRNQ